MFSLLGLVLVLRGSRVVVEHHHKQMVTHPNNVSKRDAKFIDIHWFFNDIHVFFWFILPTYFGLFLPGPPEQQQINLAWPYVGQPKWLLSLAT